MNTNPLLSVLIITYNHEKFIGKALDSALGQKTNFDYEIVIGEDCSTDKTRQILLEYKKKYPRKVKLVLQEKNVGPNENFIDTYMACTGKYIAMLEGDDYWTNANKLQTQVDFLESNTGFVIHCHDVERVFDDDCIDAPIIAREKVLKEISDIRDLVNGNFIFTASCVFIKNVKEFPVWFAGSMLTDWLLWLLTTEHGGKILYSKEKMAAYRIHAGGIYSTNNSMSYAKQLEINEGIIFQIENQIQYFNEPYLKEAFKKNLLLKVNKLRILALQNADYKTARPMAAKLIMLAVKQNTNFKIILSAALSYGFPRMHSKYLMKKKDASVAEIEA